MMHTTVTIRDTTTMSPGGYEFVLDLLTERLTVHELIRRRVCQEVDDYNTRQPKHYRGLVQPWDGRR